MKHDFNKPFLSIFRLRSLFLSQQLNGGTYPQNELQTLSNDVALEN